jgi:hypothetical protein
MYLLETLLPTPSSSKTSCFIVGSITSLRIKYAKRLSSEEKVVESDEIEKAGKEDCPATVT